MAEIMSFAASVCAMITRVALMSIIHRYETRVARYKSHHVTVQVFGAKIFSN